MCKEHGGVKCIVWNMIGGKIRCFPYNCHSYQHLTLHKFMNESMYVYYVAYECMHACVLTSILASWLFMPG